MNKMLQTTTSNDSLCNRCWTFICKIEAILFYEDALQYYKATYFCIIMCNSVAVTEYLEYDMIKWELFTPNVILQAILYSETAYQKLFYKHRVHQVASRSAYLYLLLNNSICVHQLLGVVYPDSTPTRCSIVQCIFYSGREISNKESQEVPFSVTRL